MQQDKEGLSIAMFGQRAPNDPSGGGVEVVVKELSSRMTKSHQNVTCYNRSNDCVGKSEWITEYEGVREKYVPTINRKGLAAVSSSFCAAVACAFGRYDVVHVHAEGPAAMCWIPKLFGKRIICTVHGLDHQRQKWSSFASRFIMLGEKMAVKYADEIIVLSRCVQKYFKDTYGRETKYISNGVTKPECVLPELINERFGLDKDSYILYLGRLVPEKGVHYLIDAFKNIKSDKKLVIAGGSSDSGEYMEELLQLAALDERIIFTGYVQGKILQELYSNAYVYILPSDLEGMPLSLLEAMSYGNCCLVSDIAECAEVVEDKAVTFKKSDVDDLREKLQTLCDDKEAVMKYKNEASDFICSKYDWNDVTEQTLEIYRRKEKE